jgi:hypothetical protein
VSRVYDQTCGRAARFLSASDLNNLTASAVRGYDNELSSFALAVADNDQRQIKYWKERILRSESAMLCAVVRSTTWKGAVANVVGIRRGAISGNMSVSAQAARSIG